MVSRRIVVAGFALAIAGCGVRAPARINLEAMIQAHGVADARYDLTARIVSDPKDIAARLALADLEERAQRPSAAIEQLEAVALLSGPLGTRWHADDRARLARLIAARGRARLERGARTALVDLSRAAALGATIEPKELTRARVLVAIAQLRHVDAKQRAAGTTLLAGIWVIGGAEPAWAGTRIGATAAERGAFGVWLWKVGARRAAWEQLRAWHDAAQPPRDLSLAAAYLTARAWWIPPDGPPPQSEDLVGPDRCRFAHACTAIVAASSDAATRDALMLAPPTPDHADVAAWMAITLEQALRGGGSWGPALAARIDLATVSIDSVPDWLRPAFAALAGRAPVPETEPPRTPSQRLLVAAGRALGGASFDAVSAPLRDPSVTETDLVTALQRVVRTESSRIEHPFAAALTVHVGRRVPGALDAAAIRRLTDAYARDPVIADRLGRELVAAAVDAAIAHAALGTVFDALGDPARARASWQAAVDSSAELELQRGLAESIARAKDPDAALVATVTAAAASGDPAAVWVSVARALEHTGEHVHALDASRSALGLASGRTLLDAYDVAIEASRSMRRSRQVDELLAARARLSPTLSERPTDPTDAAAALTEFRATPTAAAVDRLWMVTRWNPRDVATRAALLSVIGIDDPRSSAIIGELVGLAGDRDFELGRDAVAALRDAR